MRHLIPSLLLAFAVVVSGCADELAADTAASADATPVCSIDGPSTLTASSTAAYDALGCPSGTRSWTTSGPISVPAGANAPFVDVTGGRVLSSTQATLTYAVRDALGRTLATASKSITVKPPPPAPPAIGGLDEITHIEENGGCQPSYGASNGPVTWSVSGPATISTSGPSSSVLLTTQGYGPVQLTATNAGGSATKHIFINNSGNEAQCP